MLCAIWTALALPAIIAGMILHWKAEAWGKSNWAILPKCLSTWMIVGNAILGIWAAGDRGGPVCGFGPHGGKRIFQKTVPSGRRPGAGAVLCGDFLYFHDDVVLKERRRWKPGS